MTTLSELQVLLPELGENQLKLLRQWISDCIDRSSKLSDASGVYVDEQEIRNKLGIV